MPPQTRRLLALIEREVATRCPAAKLERGDCRFTRRQVREVTGWSNTQLHVHLSGSKTWNTCSRTGRARAGFRYELAYDGAGKDAARSCAGCSTWKNSRRAWLRRKAFGVTAPDSGSIRLISGDRAGSAREKGDSSSESASRTGHFFFGENARPRAAKTTGGPSRNRS